MNMYVKLRKQNKMYFCLSVNIET